VVAPCQCFVPGGHQTTSPARISCLASPQHWVQPTPAVTINVWPSGCVCHADRAPGSNVTLAPRARAGSGASNSGSILTAPVKYASGPLADGCDPLRLISMIPPSPRVRHRSSREARDRAHIVIDGWTASVESARGEPMAPNAISRPERAPDQPIPVAETPLPPASAAAAPPSPAPPRASAASTFLDASSAFEGVIRSGESLRLDGRVKGEIHCEDSVVIGESARIEAKVRADAVAIAGEVRGEVHAAREITLTATARMIGELTTPAIAIEEG